jgi:type I restriction enzyme S subunit
MTSQRTGWRLLRIEATCSRITSGGTPLRSNRRFYDGGSIRWVKTGELNDWYIEDTAERITEEAIQESSAKLLPSETVLMAMYGDGRTITSLGILRHESASNQASCAMITNPSVCSPLFLFYSLKAHRHALLKLAYGGAQRNLNAKTIRQFEIPVPQIPTQDRITAVLSAYDDLIENNTRRIKILEEMTQMVYREWFVNFRFPGHRSVKMIESELGPIPEGWSTGIISQTVILHREGINPADFPNECFLHFSIPSFDENRTPVKENGTEIKSNKYRVVPGCVLLSKLNPRIPRLWMPPAGAGLREITSTEFLVLTARLPLHRTYLFQLLSSEEFNSSLTGLSLGTSTSHQRVKPGDFLNLPSILPSRSVVDDFCRRVDPMMDEISVLRSKNNNLHKTRDFLLPKLISGEFPVEAAAELEEQPA